MAGTGEQAGEQRKLLCFVWSNRSAILQHSSRSQKEDRKTCLSLDMTVFTTDRQLEVSLQAMGSRLGYQLSRLCLSQQDLFQNSGIQNTQDESYLGRATPRNVNPAVTNPFIVKEKASKMCFLPWATERLHTSHLLVPERIFVFLLSAVLRFLENVQYQKRGNWARSPIWDIRSWA